MREFFKDDKGWNHAKVWNHFFDEFGFSAEVRCHAEKTEEERAASFYSPPRIWCTYLMFSDKLRFSDDKGLCKPYVEKTPLMDLVWKLHDDGYKGGPLSSLDGWNGGPTFVERTVCEQTGQRRFKIGDDHAHSWDMDRWAYYDLSLMQMRIGNVAREAHEALSALLKKPGGVD